MAICHQQPHLVPPMRLVVYDELPSPGNIKDPSRASRLMFEGKNLASRTSYRAMKAISGPRSSWRQTQSRHKPSISGPSDFIHVNNPSRHVERFRPLELSIYLPGNQLPDLPKFDEFALDQPDQPDWPTPPPKTFSPPHRAQFERRSDSPLFQIPRKPLFDQSNDSPASNSRTVAHSNRRRTLPEPIISNTETAIWQSSGPYSRPQNAIPTNAQTTIVEEPAGKAIDGTYTPPSTLEQQRSTDSKIFDSPESTTPASESTPPRSRRVAQWLHLNSSASSTPVQANFSHHIHSRSRALSGSTLSSANAEQYPRSGSITSAGTGTTLYHHPSLPTVLDKELDRSALEAPYQAIYPPNRQIYVKTEPAYQQYQGRGENDIGLAF